MNYSYEEANSPIYSDIKTRKRIALFSSIKVNNENSQAVLNIRTERVDNTFIPVTFSFGINQSYFKNTFIIHANVSKNYKLPSFNDLYYSWGGNPDLKPENGLNYEGGISYNFSNSAGDFKYNSTLFHSDMENWIKWAEVTPWVWQPQNVDKVKMDGLDNSLEYKKSISKFTLGLKGMYTYIDAINVNTDSKLTYTPEHKITGIITAFYGPLMIRFSEQYQSQVTYERSGTLNSLPGVELSNIAFSYSLSIKTTMVKATAQINNLFNKDYMYVADYPMPQRNFQVGVQFEF
jgi:iron complex outermembrane receptor protein